MVNISDGILGITLLAWGNSIGGTYVYTVVMVRSCLPPLSDAVANVTMARQGFPRMAIGACYGGPLLSILIILSYKQGCLNV